MTPARSLPPPDPQRVDHRIRLHGVSWQVYEAMLAWRGERSGVRMTYLEGELELMSPAREHELDKTLLARLLEAWAEETDTPLEGAGSWTVRDAAVERGAEADECYALGTFEGKKAPDIVIEVVWTSGGIDKLEVWRKLGAREVWFWILPKLDPELIARCMRESTQTAAVKTLRAEMRRPKKRAKK